jgi:hypothetical protein
MTEQTDPSASSQVAEKSTYEKRLDAIGWALFLIMIGCLLLIPEEQVPEGTWLIGTGTIILLLQLVRRSNDLKPSGFWLFVGLLALGAGISDFFAVEIPVFPILLVIFGASILLDPVLKRLRT